MMSNQSTPAELAKLAFDQEGGFADNPFELDTPEYIQFQNAMGVLWQEQLRQLRAEINHSQLTVKSWDL